MALARVLAHPDMADPAVLTPAEVERRLAMRDPFVREIVETGVEL